MKYYLLTFLLLKMLVSSFAQDVSRFKFGTVNTLGFSNYYYTNAQQLPNIKNPEYSFKTALGTGFKLQYGLKEKYGLCLMGTYQQRGAHVDNGINNYKITYQINYLDLSLGLYYQTREVYKRYRLHYSLKTSVHAMLSSYRANSLESYNMKKDINTFDNGVYASFGYDLPRINLDVLQVHLFANMGFRNVFGGILALNGNTGKNFIYGIEIAYLFGYNKRKTKKE
jgi:hypothetical protein